MLEPLSLKKPVPFYIASPNLCNMKTTSTPLTGSSGLEDLKGLGTAENLPVIQDIRKGGATDSLVRTAAQLSMLEDYKGATKPNDHKSTTNLLAMTNESKKESSPSVSDSEDEDNAVPTTLSISEKRKAQNSKFSAW